MPRILILSDSSSEYSRQLLKGVVRYGKQCGDWSFYRLPLYFREQYGEDGVVAWAQRWEADGVIIAQANNLNIEKFLELNIPVVCPNLADTRGKLSTLTGNYHQGGVIAASYFIGRGYRHFAFYGVRSLNWSLMRSQGFQQRIEKEGHLVHYFEGELIERNGQWGYVYDELSQWLKSLPKPIAIFASADYFAIHITETCRICNLKVPDEIAIIGVDDDPLICEMSDPPLSSIQLDVENSGFQTAAHLHKCIVGERIEPFNIEVSHTGVIERKSTELYATEDKKLYAVVTYIRNNLHKSIHIADLLRFSYMSRRVLEKRFKEQFKTSIYQFILQLRVEALAYQLIHSDAPLYTLIEQCGFEDPKNVSRIFKKIKGITPLSFRIQFKRE